MEINPSWHKRAWPFLGELKSCRGSCVRADLDEFPRILQIANKGEQRIRESGPEILILSRINTRSKAISIDRVGKQYAEEDGRGLLQIILAA